MESALNHILLPRVSITGRQSGQTYPPDISTRPTRYSRIGWLYKGEEEEEECSGYFLKESVTDFRIFLYLDIYLDTWIIPKKGVVKQIFPKRGGIKDIS